MCAWSYNIRRMKLLQMWLFILSRNPAVIFQHLLEQLSVMTHGTTLRRGTGRAFFHAVSMAGSNNDIGHVFITNTQYALKRVAWVRPEWSIFEAYVWVHAGTRYGLFVTWWLSVCSTLLVHHCSSHVWVASIHCVYATVSKYRVYSGGQGAHDTSNS